MDDTSWTEQTEVSCLLFISNWMADRICWSSCDSKFLNSFAKTVATDSGFFLGVEWVSGPPAPLGSWGSIGMNSNYSHSSRVLSSRNLIAMEKILDLGLWMANCIEASTQEGLSFILYMSCIGIVTGNSTKHSKGSEWFKISPFRCIIYPKGTKYLWACMWEGLPFLQSFPHALAYC